MQSKKIWLVVIILLLLTSTLVIFSEKSNALTINTIQTGKFNASVEIHTLTVNTIDTGYFNASVEIVEWYTCTDDETSEPGIFPTMYNNTPYEHFKVISDFLVIENTKSATINGTNAWLELRTNGELWDPFHYSINWMMFFGPAIPSQNIEFWSDDIGVWAKIAEDDNTTWNWCGTLNETTWDDTGANGCTINSSDWDYEWNQNEHMWVRFELGVESTFQNISGPDFITYITKQYGVFNGTPSWRVRGYNEVGDILIFSSSDYNLSFSMRPIPVPTNGNFTYSTDGFDGTFNDTTTDQVGLPFPPSFGNFSWDFGDSETGTGPNVTHTYDDYGKYEVTLTVTDGATTYHIETITISEEPESEDLAWDYDWLQDMIWIILLMVGLGIFASMWLFFRDRLKDIQRDTKKVLK